MKRRRSARKTLQEATAGVVGAASRRPARICREMKVDGARFWTLFDSGARRTYVVEPVAKGVGLKPVPQPFMTALGGRKYRVTAHCALGGKVEGYGVTADAFVIDRLFPDEEGRPIEIIVGAETMETWGIWLDMPQKQLDFTHYQREAYEG